MHKLDVKKAMLMKEKKHPEYAVILAFDVKVSPEAKTQVAHLVSRNSFWGAGTTPIKRKIGRSFYL